MRKLSLAALLLLLIPVRILPAEELVRRINPAAFPAELKRLAERAKTDDLSTVLFSVQNARGSGYTFDEKKLFLEGLIQMALGKQTDGKTSLRGALGIKASSSDTLVALASAERSSDPQRAVQLLEEALWFNKFQSLTSLDAQRELAEIYLILPTPEPEKAKAAIAGALAADPSDPSSRRQLAEMQLESGDRKGAIESLRTALAQTPSDAGLQLALSKSLLKGANRVLQRPDLAESLKLATGVAQSPGVSMTDRRAAQLLQVRSLEALGRTQEAKDEVAALLAASPNDPELTAMHEQLTLELKAGSQAYGTEEPK